MHFHTLPFFLHLFFCTFEKCNGIAHDNLLMSDKIGTLQHLYETSPFSKDKLIFADVITKAFLLNPPIQTSVRSLKLYKAKWKWENKTTLKDTLNTIKADFKKVDGNKVLKVAKKRAVVTPPIAPPINEYNPVAIQDKLTEIMTFLLQGASKAKIFEHYKNKGETITRQDVDKLAQEAYNIYANIAPSQRETILGVNYERLNMLFGLVLQEIKNTPKSTGFLAGKAVQIMGEINSMFGIKSINLNVNSSDGIQNKINNMTDEERFKRLIELKQKEDGSYGE